MKKILKILILIIFLALFVWTGKFLYSKSQKKTEIFGTEQAYIGNIVQKTVATGSIVPKKEIEIKPQLSGIVDALFVKAGQKVAKGDPIARIRVIPSMNNLNAAENRVNRAKIALSNSQKTYDRNQPLFKQGIISAQEFQQYENGLANSKEELLAANDNLQIIKKGVSSRYSSQGNSIVRSTVTGMVLEVPIEIGNSVIQSNNFNPGTTVAFVADMSEMIFEGNVDESEVGKLKLGMDIILNIGAIEDKSFNATLNYIAPKGKDEQGAIKFEIEANVEEQEDVFIRAGYSASADIVLEHRDSVLTIQESLVQFDKKGKPFVEIEKDSQNFEKHDIELGLSDGIQVEVLKGVSLEDQIKGKVIEDAPKKGPRGRGKK
jgi:HlyD family secretion protein